MTASSHRTGGSVDAVLGGSRVTGVSRLAEPARFRWSGLVVTVSRPIGGVLSLGSLAVTEVVAIHLCGLPGEIDRTGPPTFDLAPGGGCLAAEVTLDAGALLPHRFTLACSRFPGSSAVCSLLPCTDRSPRPGSHQHPVLRSPDLPRRGRAQELATPRPPGRLTVGTSLPRSRPGTQGRSVAGC